MKKGGYILILLTLVLFISGCGLSESEKAAKENVSVAREKINLGDYFSAFDYLNEAIKLDLNNDMAYWLRGQIYIALNDIDSGCEDLSKASSLTYWSIPDIENFSIKHCSEWTKNQYD